jgi:hypothetical protein
LRTAGDADRPIAPQHAAEILRPRAVHGAVDDDVADMPRAQILRLGRKAQKGIDLSFHELLDRLDGTVGDPAYVLDGVEPDMRGHQGHQHVRGRPPVLHPDAPALEIRDVADVFLREQFEAADMRAGQDHDRLAASIAGISNGA